MTTIRQFIIPRITATQVAMIGARAAGEIANSIAAEARRNAPRNNPYTGQINQYTPNADLPIKGHSTDFGTPIWDEVTFGTVLYTDDKGKDVMTPTITFQAILVSVTFHRNIVKTAIQGRDGTVKEYIGEGDAQITFRGIITGENGQYPSEEVSNLKQMMKAPVAIPVTSRFLQNLDIHSIVFEDRNLEQEEGGYSYQAFSLNAVSEIPIELQIGL